MLDNLVTWQYNGSKTTIDEFRVLDEVWKSIHYMILFGNGLIMKKNILMTSMLLQAIALIGNPIEENIIFVHAGIDGESEVLSC